MKNYFKHIIYLKYSGIHSIKLENDKKKKKT